MSGLALTVVPKELYYVELALVEQQAAEILRLRDLVRGAYSEGFSQGMREFSSSRGGNTWNESRAFLALSSARREESK